MKPNRIKSEITQEQENSLFHVSPSKKMIMGLREKIQKRIKELEQLREDINKVRKV